MRDNIVAVVINGACILENNDHGAILATQSILEILDNTLGFQPGEYAFAVDRVDVQLSCLADRFHFLDTVVAQHFNQCRVRCNQVAVARRNIDTIDHVFEQAAITCFTAAQLFLVLSPLDRNTGEASHTAEFVQFIRGRRARLI